MSVLDFKYKVVAQNIEVVQNDLNVSCSIQNLLKIYLTYMQNTENVLHDKIYMTCLYF